jgi:hypothetical protein
LLDYLRNQLKLNISEKINGFLSDESNPHYEYDLLGLLKGEMVAELLY